MSIAEIKKIITTYYDAFNQKDMDTFSQLLSEHVIHDINQQHREIGKSRFMDFMRGMNICYSETVKDLVIMVSDDQVHAAAEFTIQGIYLKTDNNLPEARGQEYQLPVGTFFEIREQHIARVTTYYNLKNWLEQVS